MAEEKRGRPRREELSETQRRVLDLLVQGRTNGEVAGELGISLDGAKYHVREICDRVGVDTREEAAEWWRQQRGLRARFALGDLGARVGRMPALLRWGIGGAGVTALAAGVLLFLLLPGVESHPGPGLYVAYVVPVSEPPPEDLPDDYEPTVPHTELHLVYPGGERVFDGGTWGELRWSPDGSRLAGIHYANAGEPALGAPEPPDLELIDVPSGDRETIAADTVGSLYWSPDSTRLALTAQGRVMLFDASGETIAEFVDADREEDTGEEYRLLDGYGLNECPTWNLFTQPPGPREAWSSDSEHLAMDTGDEVVILDRDGEPVSRASYDELRDVARPALEGGGRFPPDERPERGLYSPWSVNGRWLDDSTLQAILPVRERDDEERLERCVAVMEGTLVDGEVRWELQEDILRMDHLRAELNRTVDSAAYRGDWVPTGPGERFEGGRVDLEMRYGQNVDAAWVVYAEDGAEPRNSDEPRVAMVVHRNGELDVFETDMDPGWAKRNPDWFRSAFAYDAWYVAPE